ncbi:hypothetical protein VIGAN_03298700, partial [Vigna angularis var. angularis]
NHRRTLIPSSPNCNFHQTESQIIQQSKNRNNEKHGEVRLFLVTLQSHVRGERESSAGGITDSESGRTEGAHDGGEERRRRRSR